MTIRGDSMIDAGLMPGDIAVVRKGVLPSVGDIVIAFVDGETTYTVGMEKGAYFALGNQRYPNINPQGHTGSIRVGCR